MVTVSASEAYNFTSRRRNARALSQLRTLVSRWTPGRLVWLVASVAVGGCASVDVKPLDVDGKKVLPNADAGLRYYMPKPYLLVMRLPPDAPVGAQAAGTVQDPSADHTVTEPSDSSHPAPGGGPAGHTTTDASHSATGTGSTPSSDTGGKQTGQPDSGAPAAAVASTQFSASNGRYVAKLVYLPDLSKPMAVTTRTGLGAVTLGATLQEGWMLTSLQANSDSKTAEILTAIAAGISGTHGGGGSGGGGAGKQQPSGGPNVLPAGLYMFDYGTEPAKGVIVRLCYVTLFESVPANGSSALPHACSSPPG